jgi:hypothetical protein
MVGFKERPQYRLANNGGWLVGEMQPTDEVVEDSRWARTG